MHDAHEKLIEEILAEVRATSAEIGFDRLDPAVEAAMRAVPRHRFLSGRTQALAYLNSPLPIGSGQTISQPYIVAIMSQLLEIGKGDRVLEIGTGSGYQAAVLAEMGAEVYSLEIHPELAVRAAETLEALGYGRVHVQAGDGWLGWPEAAPFDGIIVTAAAPRVPTHLFSQLGAGRRLVIPLGSPDGIQVLASLSMSADGRLARRDILPVRFVPVTGSLSP